MLLGRPMTSQHLSRAMNMISGRSSSSSRARPPRIRRTGWVAVFQVLGQERRVMLRRPFPAPTYGG